MYDTTQGGFQAAPHCTRRPPARLPACLPALPLTLSKDLEKNLPRARGASDKRDYLKWRSERAMSLRKARAPLLGTAHAQRPDVILATAEYARDLRFISSRITY